MSFTCMCFFSFNYMCVCFPPNLWPYHLYGSFFSFSTTVFTILLKKVEKSANINLGLDLPHPLHQMSFLLC